MRTTKEDRDGARGNIAARVELDGFVSLANRFMLALLDDADAAEDMRAALVAIGRYEIACDEHGDPHELEDARRAANKADALARRLAEEADRG